jgi:hypothetical protein
MLLCGAVSRVLTDTINTCLQLQKDLLREKIIVVFLGLSLFVLNTLAAGSFRKMKKKQRFSKIRLDAAVNQSKMMLALA